MKSITVKDREYPIEEVEVPEGTLRFVIATVRFDDDDEEFGQVRIALGTELDELITLGVNPVSDELRRLDESVFFYCEDATEFIDLAVNPVAGMEWRIV